MEHEHHRRSQLGLGLGPCPCPPDFGLGLWHLQRRVELPHQIHECPFVTGSRPLLRPLDGRGHEIGDCRGRVLLTHGHLAARPRGRRGPTPVVVVPLGSPPRHGTRRRPSRGAWLLSRFCVCVRGPLRFVFVGDAVVVGRVGERIEALLTMPVVDLREEAPAAILGEKCRPGDTEATLGSKGPPFTARRDGFFRTCQASLTARRASGSPELRLSGCSCRASMKYARRKSESDVRGETPSAR